MSLKDEKLSEHQDSSFQSQIIRKLIQGIDQAILMKDKIKFKNKILSAIEVEGSMIPTVKLVYTDINYKLDKEQ